MSFNIIISRSAIFLSLLNSLAPWNHHFEHRKCLASEFNKIRSLDCEDKILLSEYTEAIGRTEYGEIENCFFHKGGLKKTLFLIEKKLSKDNSTPLKELIDRFYDDFNLLWNKFFQKLMKRKIELDEVLSNRLFEISFQECKYIFDCDINKVIDVYLIPRIKNSTFGTLISNFKNQKILIIDIFNINKKSNNQKDLMFASLVILHEFCHYILADRNNSVSKIFSTIKRNYTLSNKQILDLEEILILNLYPTGILGVKSNLIKGLKLEGKRNSGVNDHIGKSAQRSLSLLTDHFHEIKKILNHRLIDNIFKLSNTISKSIN